MKINQPFQVFVRIRPHHDATNPIEVINENAVNLQNNFKLRIQNREMNFQKIFTENETNI